MVTLPVFALGHSNRTLEDSLALLDEQGVEVLGHHNHNHESYLHLSQYDRLAEEP